MLGMINIVSIYYTFKQGVTDTVLLSIAGLMKLITDIDTGTFAEGVKESNNNVLSIIAYLGMFSVLIGRAFLIYYKVRAKRQDLLDKELDHKIKVEEHLSTNAVWLKMRTIEGANNSEELKEAISELTEGTNKSHEEYIKNLKDG